MRFTVNTIVILSASVLLGACGSSKKARKITDKLPGTWQAQPIIIDGDSKDWPSPYPNYDAKSMMAYATSNDGTNLYITVETGDEITQLKILKAGMTISVDTGGKKDPQFHITYPMQNDNENLELPQPNHSKEAMHVDKQFSRQVKKFVDQANQFTLEGFHNCNGGFQVAQVLPCGVKVKEAIDEYNELVWEAVIPLKSLYGRETLSATDAGKPISVCVSIKGIKAPKKGSGADEQAGNIGTGGTGMTGMGGGRGGGGGKGGRGGGGRAPVENPLDRLYTSTKTWKVFGLTTQP